GREELIDQPANRVSRLMMNNAVTAPALSSTWTCAPIELDRARVGVRASRFAAHHGAQHVSRCIMTPDICPSTASVQPSTLDSGEASIYVQGAGSAVLIIAIAPFSARTSNAARAPRHSAHYAAEGGQSSARQCRMRSEERRERKE